MKPFDLSSITATKGNGRGKGWTSRRNTEQLRSMWTSSLKVGAWLDSYWCVISITWISFQAEWDQLIGSLLIHSLWSVRESWSTEKLHPHFFTNCCSCVRWVHYYAESQTTIVSCSLCSANEFWMQRGREFSQVKKPLILVWPFILFCINLWKNRLKFLALWYLFVFNIFFFTYLIQAIFSQSH